jgi:hypothetical protein
VERKEEATAKGRRKTPLTCQLNKKVLLAAVAAVPQDSIAI